MPNGSYDTRKEQIAAFKREMVRILKQQGIGYLDRTQHRAINDALKSAAMVGASEERFRALTMMSVNDPLRERIVATPILAVLGYE